MIERSHTRSGAFAVLALLLLLALAVGAQAAAAAHLSNGPASTTPAAGTEGRGGVSGTTTVAVVSTSPAAGTIGRGGVALVQTGTFAGLPVVTENGFVSRARGGFPGGPLGVQRRLAVSTIDSTRSGWIVAGLAAAAIAVVGGFFVWAASRRRAWQQQSSMASYCTYHPGDALC